MQKSPITGEFRIERIYLLWIEACCNYPTAVHVSVLSLAKLEKVGRGRVDLVELDGVAVY